MSTPNGHRSRAPAGIAENASGLKGSVAIAGQREPGRRCGNNGDTEKPTSIQDVSTPSVAARTLGSTDSRSSDMIGSAGRSDNGAGEGAERAILLATKLHVPAIGGQLVHRGALLDALSAGRRRKLTLLSAPAGWGKTTLLAQWALGAGEDQRFGWLSLDRSDNDPVWFGCMWSPRCSRSVLGWGLARSNCWRWVPTRCRSSCRPCSMIRTHRSPDGAHSR